MHNKLSLLYYLNTENKNISIVENYFDEESDDTDYHFSVIVDDEKIEDVLKFKNIDGLSSVVDFLSLNSFIFNIKKPYKINKSNEFINITFDGLFSSSNVLQYDTIRNKYKLIIHSYIIAIDVDSKSESEFNLLCYKISSSNKIKNKFSIKFKNTDLIELKNFINELSIPFSSMTDADLDLFQIVKY